MCRNKPTVLQYFQLYACISIIHTICAKHKQYNDAGKIVSTTLMAFMAFYCTNGLECDRMIYWKIGKTMDSWKIEKVIPDAARTCVEFSDMYCSG